MTELKKLQAALDSAVGMPKVHWTCSRCGTACVRIDNGKGRQWVTCMCGQGIILLNTAREGWLD